MTALAKTYRAQELPVQTVRKHLQKIFNEKLNLLAGHVKYFFREMLIRPIEWLYRVKTFASMDKKEFRITSAASP